ncbi:MAG: right-handed parallel beta-helix repeat-containing protein [Myxococcota bacterium]
MHQQTGTMRRGRIVTFVALAFTLLTLSCGNSAIHTPTSESEQSSPVDAPRSYAASTEVCSGGTTRACGCPTARVIGVQRCASDGSSYRECECIDYGLNLFVKPSASASGNGTQSDPYRDLEQARAHIRTLKRGSGLPDGGVGVWLRAGAHRRSSSFELTNEDSGTGERPIAYRAYPGEQPRVMGAVRMPTEKVRKANSNDALWPRLPDGSKGTIHVVEAEGVSSEELGELMSRDFDRTALSAPAELMINGRRMRLARWPNIDAHSPPEVVGGFARISEALSEQRWKYSGSRPSAWYRADKVWFHGFWRYYWADGHYQGEINTSDKSVTLTETPSHGISDDRYFYAYDLPEELDAPGEYVIDRARGKIYFIPPSDFNEFSELWVSTLDGAVLRVSGAHDVSFRDLRIGFSRREAVWIGNGAKRVELVGGRVNDSGKESVKLGGITNSIDDVRILRSGTTGIGIEGELSDRESLSAQNNRVTNSYIYDTGFWEWSYRPAVGLRGGAGNKVLQNTIRRAPHSAITFTGNKHSIERNDISEVGRYAGDAGAIYSGRDWGAHGNLVKHNFIHDISTYFDESVGVHGVYLDDCLSGVVVTGNVMFNLEGRGLMHGGGRDNALTNNIIVGTRRALYTDQRCYEWHLAVEAGTRFFGPNDREGDSFNLLEKIERFDYRRPPWSTAYPDLARIPDDWSTIVSDSEACAQGSASQRCWLFPEGNVVTRNLTNDNGEPADWESIEYFEWIDNNVHDQDPQFVDRAQRDMRLKPSSPAFSIKNWQPIPFGEIGVH